MPRALRARTLPFLTFMAFIGIDELIKWVSHLLPSLPSDSFHIYLYPLKVLVVSALLFYYRKEYKEITLRDLTRPQTLLIATATGITVFILWINMDWSFATFGSVSNYNPTELSGKLTVYFLIAFRLAGAAIVVPIMEELFWRSFILRYIINPDFELVAIGTLTWSSFLISSTLFGLEHNLWLAGIMAGSAYTLLVYRTKSISACVIAHGITNFLLGIYVLLYGRWEFW